LGKTYTAEIIFGANDSTRYPFFSIDNKQINSKNLFYDFSTKINSNTKKDSFGYFLFESPATGEILEFPFNIEFEIIK